jgi:hypothetical protein
MIKVGMVLLYLREINYYLIPLLVFFNRAIDVNVDEDTDVYNFIVSVIIVLCYMPFIYLNISHH